MSGKYSDGQFAEREAISPDASARAGSRASDAARQLGARSRWRRALTAALIVPLFIAASARLGSAATSGQNGTHDPSRMIESDGRFYVYSTQNGSKSSPDGLVWTNGPPIFSGAFPSSTTSVVSNNEGLWAPDIIYLNGQYYLYYSIANASNACAVGLVTSPTLNPSSPNYKWTDRGLVVSNNGSATYCTIDPAPLLDATGNLWLAWGSGYSHPSTSNTIFVTRLDNTTGLASSADTTKPGHALEQGHIEASYIYYHSGYYYLFWNSGGCCSGASSTYLIHMARSTSVTGPYTGTRNFYGSTGGIHGPGHIGIYDQCGASRFTYHYYPDAGGQANSGGAVLGENELQWGSDGWPTVGPVSTTPLKACGQTGGGAGAGGSAGAGGGASGGGGAPGGSTSDGGGAGLSSGGDSTSGGAPTTGTAGDTSATAGTPSDIGGSGGTPQVGNGGAIAGSANVAGNTGTGTPAAGSSGAADPTSGSGCSFRADGSRGAARSAVGVLLMGAVLERVGRRWRKRRARH